MDDLQLNIPDLPKNRFSVENNYLKIEYTSAIHRKNMRVEQIVNSSLKSNVTFLNFVKENCDDDDMIDNMIFQLFKSHITN